MIDRDGIERPDNPSEHMLTIKNTNRKVKFDENYSFRPRNIFQRMWSRFFRRLAITVFHVHWDFAQTVKLRNKKNLKGLRKKGFVIVVNHVSMFDDVSVCSTIFHWRMVYFTTLEQNIRRPMIGFYLRSLGGIPIPVSSVSGMRKFESDVSEGNNVTIDDYVVNDKVDYTTTVGDMGYKFGNLVEGFMNEGLKKTLRFFSALFYE